jgi:hypothetical protein|tara:strand:+ start:7698 stop:7979 length:282 start_codon:yes stop_codon:yes gene_type:complete
MSTLNTITVGEDWINVHANTYLVGLGLEDGDQINIQVVSVGSVYIHQGDSSPTQNNNYKPFISENEIYTSVDGENLWLKGNKENINILVSYAP